MIALPSQLPLLRVGPFELTTYEGAWIATCIRSAAARAGHQDWWFAEDIARGVVAYLKTRFPATAITIEQLQQKICLTLATIGFQDVAAEVTVDPPLIRVNLHDLARQSEGIELVFFQLLDHRVSQLQTVGAKKLSLTGTKAAIKKLRATKNWNPQCRVLEHEIVHLVRNRLSRHADGNYELQLESV
jgi:hypothetical protein